MTAARTTKIFRGDSLPWSMARTATGNTRIARVIDRSLSDHIGAGIEVLDKVSIAWTVTYDEVLFIHEGEMTIRTGGDRWACQPGDIVWLPNGTTLEYDATKGRCAYFYALYPVDWATRQGVEEP
jgi:ethanolamine utilization protein EutQ